MLYELLYEVQVKYFETARFETEKEKKGHQYQSGLRDGLLDGLCDGLRDELWGGNLENLRKTFFFN